MTASSSVSAKIPEELRAQVDEIARIEQRTASSVVRMAIEQFVAQYNELHPRLQEDILVGLSEMRSGDVAPYDRGVVPALA
jgi:predicted transcriptional regulator